MTTTNIDVATTVGQLVTERPARSRVFQELGIDFCCGGKKPLQEACHAKGLDPQAVLQMLLAAEQADDSQGLDAARLSLGELCDHIEQTHHAYLKQELPRLQAMIAKVAAVHGERCPWMRDVHEVFEPFMRELTSHMMKEEQVLFPMIRAMELGKTNAACHCGGTIANPIRMMEHEHDDAGDALRRLRELTDGYSPPADACNTFRAALDGLRELEADMHQHVHKENNVLFPRAMDHESQQMAAGKS
ncbi:MAG: iron-sulfur cluster repair di-iron protein [Phycisphaeraceae bacterium]|nr:iron-sulfur cluster repair di-iron protein [Phycisphaeraceae bacterium]